MSFGDRLLGWIPWVLGTLIIAGIVHIVSVLAMPRLAAEDAFSRFARVTPLHKLTILTGRPDAASLVPFEDPANALAVCRFDLKAGPVRLRGRLSGDGLVLMSFRNRFGTAFYSMNDRGTSRGNLNVVLVTAEQLEAIEANDPEDDVPNELRLSAPSLEGFIVLRALAPERSQFAEAVQSLKTIDCKLDPLPETSSEAGNS
ncbi:MAG: hypothetical protein AB7F96_02665 [Beijerinckiaceae bacterium]